MPGNTNPPPPLAFAGHGGGFILSTKSTGSEKVKSHLFRVAKNSARLRHTEFFCIGSDFSSAEYYFPIYPSCKTLFYVLSHRKSLLATGKAAGCGLKNEGAAATYASRVSSPECVDGLNPPLSLAFAGHGGGFFVIHMSWAGHRQPAMHQFSTLPHCVPYPSTSCLMRRPSSSKAHRAAASLFCSAAR